MKIMRIVCWIVGHDMRLSSWDKRPLYCRRCDWINR